MFLSFYRTLPIRLTRKTILGLALLAVVVGGGTMALKKLRPSNPNREASLDTYASFLAAVQKLHGPRWILPLTIGRRLSAPVPSRMPLA